MKPHTLAFLLALCAAAAAHADQPIRFDQGMELVTKYNCQSCHSVDQTIAGPYLMAGPSFYDIAKRYASDPHARGVLGAHILNGSLGAWGPFVMSPAKVPDADLEPLVEWILSLRQY